MDANRRSRHGAAAAGSGQHQVAAPDATSPRVDADRAPSFRDLEALEFVSNLLPIGILLVDGSGQVVWMNWSARTRLDAGDALALRRGRLSARSHADTEALHRLIERVVAPGPRDPEVLTVSQSTAGGSRLVIVVRAIERLGVRPTRGAAARAVIFLSDVEHQLHASRHRLRRLFGLTPAETELTALLAEGCSVRAAAEHLAITNESARTYLKRVLQKTGTRRQAELVRLALSLATAGANEA